MRMEWEIHFSWDLCEKKNSHMKIIREFDENLTSHLRIISLKWDQVRVIWGYVRSRENHMRSCEIIWDFSVREGRPRIERLICKYGSVQYQIQSTLSNISPINSSGNELVIEIWTKDVGALPTRDKIQWEAIAKWLVSRIRCLQETKFGAGLIKPLSA